MKKLSIVALLAALFLRGGASRSIQGSTDGSLAASVSGCRRIVAGHNGRIDARPSISGGLGLVIRLPLHGKTSTSGDQRAEVAKPEPLIRPIA